MTARCFIVACPRSGTTILQSLLAAHPAIVSFPETNFFPRLFPRPPEVCPEGMASLRAHKLLHRLLAATGHEDLADRVPGVHEPIGAYVSAFVDLLDTLTLREGGSVWVEKTPQHLRFVDLIETTVPEARFVHIVRDGRDVVASLYAVSHEHPESWGGQLDLSTCVRRWLKAMRRTRRHLAKPNHVCVRYHELLRDPEAELSRLCHFLGVPYDTEMGSRAPETAPRLIWPNETWKHGTLGGLGEQPAKFRHILGPEQQAYVLEQLRTEPAAQELAGMAVE